MYQTAIMLQTISSLSDYLALYLKQLIFLNKLQMNGWWLVHSFSKILVLHLAKTKNNFQQSHIRPQIHLTADNISVP
jgi:uncharacterized membrane protein YdfJ with MMPL/SSD domain